MAFSTLITLTTAGADTGPFNLYSNIDGYTVAFESNVPKLSLEAGYLSTLVPDTTTIIRVASIATICSNYVDLAITGITTTTTTSTSTSTTTSTSTSTSTTTSTTTTVAPPQSALFGTSNVDGPTACADVSPTTLYWAAGAFGAGVTLYTNIGLTVPFTEIWVAHTPSSEYWELNGAGLVISISGVSC